MVIGIIGGGASGMAAALAAAESPQNQVLLLERQQRVGRKLQATGNGRCNLTNLHALEGGYHGEEREFSQYALERFSPAETLKWFEHLGLVTVAEASGRAYPFSDQANSVVDILRFALYKPNIRLETGVEVQKAKREEDGFLLETTQGVFSCHRLIIACGGLAGTKLGGSMSGYKLLRSLGHRCTRLRPALVQIKTDWPGITALKGVRAQCKAEITCDGAFWSGSRGEIQFTEWGLSGPVMFEISRDVCQKKGNWVCTLDLLPQIEEETLVSLLEARRKTNLPASELFTGILHNRLGRVLTQECGITANREIAGLSGEDLKLAAKTAKCFPVHLTEALGMDSAQVTAGGIVTEEFYSNTLESKLVPGLYACGEVLDVDGDCGGYNLQWAWSSGRLAGQSAGKEENNA